MEILKPERVLNFSGSRTSGVLFGKSRKKTLFLLGLMSVAFGMSACSSVEQDWVSIAGKVKNVQGITDQGGPAKTSAEVLFNRVSFEYSFENKSYENSEVLGLNVRRTFAQGQTIPLKVNAKNPSLSKIDLPPELPDRTGMTLRRGLHQETPPGSPINRDY